MLNIQLISPLPGKIVEIKDRCNEVQIIVHITLGCGAPACSGGRWDAKKIQAKACISAESKTFPDISLIHTGSASEFKGNLPIKTSGRYSLTIEAVDPESGKAGRLNSSLIVK